MTTKIIELTDDEIVHIRVALFMRINRLKRAIDSTADCGDVSGVRADCIASCEAIDALLADKMRREGQ